MFRAAVIGNTSWGTTLALVLARKGTRVKLLTRTEKEALELNEKRENTTLLPGIRLPLRIRATSSAEEALEGAGLVILAIPAQSMRRNVRVIKDYLDSSMIIISAAKGLELGSTKRMTQVIVEEVDLRFSHNICALSGPNLAGEIARGSHAVTVVASRDISVAERAQEMMSAPHFYVFTNTDVVGVELCGALKNIIALGAGIADGMGYGDNAKAAYITRGLAEITSLGVVMGADPLTFSGLAGLGDIVATCSSNLSRNHYVGVELARGRPLEEITASTPHVAEGIATTKAAWGMAASMGVEMPITNLMYRVLFEDLNVRRAAAEILEYPARQEMGIKAFLKPLSSLGDRKWWRPVPLFLPTAAIYLGLRGKFRSFVRILPGIGKNHHEDR
jgi:glycerol-3-phosphate dehydrogenase (NAD(P)+)